MAELGEGIRVYVGFVPHDKRGRPGGHCFTGTIVRMPTFGEVLRHSPIEMPCWIIDPDDGRGLQIVSEKVLFPIDDDDDFETIEEAKPTEEEVEA